jgi:hypothetical protein
MQEDSVDKPIKCLVTLCFDGKQYLCYGEASSDLFVITSFNLTCILKYKILHMCMVARGNEFVMDIVAYNNFESSLLS